MINQLELPLECKNEDHIWSPWEPTQHITIKDMSSRDCLICDERQILVPKPSPLPARSSFSLFLADFKARMNL
jgi:hypothetical protein